MVMVIPCESALLRIFLPKAASTSPASASLRPLGRIFAELGITKLVLRPVILY